MLLLVIIPFARRRYGIGRLARKRLSHRASIA
jgi:hypothetical protein